MVDRSISFVRALCLGEIEQDVILPYPALADEERETLRAVVDSVDQLLAPHEADFRSWDHAGELPPSFVDELRSFGLFGLVIPEQHGGMGMHAAAYSRTLQQVARHDASVAVTIGAHSSIGMRGLLLYGTDAQKARWMPALASGEMIAAFCLTEPGAGSDAASIKTTAVKDGDDWILNGSKLWITNGGIASFFTVFAKTGGVDERGKLSGFIVTRDMPGVSVGPHEDKMGLRASSTTSVYFDNARVTPDHLLGPEHGGFKVAMHILNNGRTGLGGGAVGASKRLIELAAKQAKTRQQFGRPIAEFGLVKQKLGQMAIDTYAAESVVNLVAGIIDQGYEEYAIEAAISKVFASEALWRTADEALQVAGGNGFMREYPYERVVRDARINRIFEGTNEVLRLFIALSAMNDVGTQLRELSSSLRGVFDDPIKGFGVMSAYALRRAALATGLGGGKRSFTKLEAPLGDAAAIFEQCTRALATATDRILRKHGKHIIGKQFASSRLANIMIDLFVLASVMSRVNASVLAKGAAGSARELEILHAFMHQARRRIDDALARVDDNDDETIKSLADFVVEQEKFPWDNL
ncbi:MAG: acyl-CoA dehydrogenase family protein [Nannocystaceae bacterium]|nr:acyl-CoA dehydrogenase family protein [Deltaproteobacteria bacterium]MBP7287975.1 acyl-CoA dehydrogenase family protein [Nannocystaceae bacterium]